LSEFEDDKHSSRLLTFLSHNPPVLVLHSKHDLSTRTTQILKNVLANVKKESLLNDSQLWSAEKTLKALAEKYYTDADAFPEELKPFLDKSKYRRTNPFFTIFTLRTVFN
jgi:DNA mismatch repair protein MSH6